MKLKIFKSFVVAVAVIGSACGLSSCKDTDQDLYDQFNNQIDQLTAENATLGQKLDADIALLQGKLDQLTQKYLDLQNLMAQCQQNCEAAWTLALAQLRADIANGYVSKDDFNALAARLDNYLTIAEFNAFKAQYTELAGQVGALATTIDDIQSVLDEAKGGHGTIGERFIAVENALDGLQGTIQQLTAELGNLQTSIATVQGNLDTAVANLQGQIDANNAQISGLQGQVDNLQSQISANAGNISDLQNEVQTLQGQIASLQGQIDVINQAISDLNDLRAQVQNNTTAIASLTSSVSAIQNELANLNTLVNNALSIANTALVTAQAQEARLDAQEQLIAVLQSELANAISNLSAEDQRLADAIADNAAEISNNGAKIAANEAAIAQLRLDLEAAKAEAAANLAAAKAELVQLIDNKIEALRQQIQSQLGDVNDRIDGVDDRIDGVDDRIDGVDNRIDGVDNRIDNTDTYIQAVEAMLNTSVADLRDDIDALDARLTDLEGKVGDNAAEIQNIKNDIDDLTGRLDQLENQVDALNNRISGIVLQQVVNPITGSVSLPFDVQSMILFNYWGETTTPVVFPNFSPFIGTNFGGDADLSDPSFITQAPTSITIPSSTRFIDESDGNFGKVYFTVNPSNVDLTGKTFSLVNSQDQAIPVELRNVKPSNAVLSFGASRAATSPNGFYEADATLRSASEVSAINYELESGLKSALKDAAKERTLSSISEVARLVYKQFSKGLPAYGMKAAWDENGVAQSVTSNYGIAATSVRPLSYSFLEGSDFSGRLRDFPSLDRLVDRLHLDLDAPTITFPPVDIETINSADFDYSFPIHVNTSFTIVFDELTAVVHVTVPAQPIEVKDEYGVVVGTATVPGGTYDGFATVGATGLGTQIQTQLEAKFIEMFGELEASMQNNIRRIVSEVCQKINETVLEQLRDLLLDTEQSVQDNIDDIVNRIQNTVNGKVESVANRIERYYDKVESVYNRFKRFMSDPNHYLQVVMLYHADDNMGRLSSAKALPTVFTGTGTAVTLIPTSYSADILCPSYKKYVAISNVFTADGKDCTNDATCRNLRDAANAGQYMNSIISGERLTIAFDFSAARAASGQYTYEIYYQSLDYHGYTSTQKFYVTIK